MNPWIDRYLGVHRPVLARSDHAPDALWLSSKDGRPQSYGAAQRATCQTTPASVGVEVSPHLFRAAAASMEALRAGHTPHLASALLHRDHPTVAAEHYNRPSSLAAAQIDAEIIRNLRDSG
jgi:site-specific recombinase XerD